MPYPTAVCRSDGRSSRLARSPHIQWLVALVPPTAEPDCQRLQHDTASVDSRLAADPDITALRANVAQSGRSAER